MRMSTRKVVPGKRNIVGARVTEARSAAGMLQKDLLTHLQVAGMEISTQGAVRNSERRCPLAVRPDLKSPLIWITRIM